MNRPGPVALLVLLIASTALPLAAQTAQITGRVVDSSGGVITGAKVSVRNIETGVARSVDTNDQGYYAAPLLTRGQYEVIAEMTGFRSAR
jgi:hypothetical protein